MSKNHLTPGYLYLPTFVVCENGSAYEGETMHRVGELERRGDYHYKYANYLMKWLLKEYCRRLEESVGRDAVTEFFFMVKKEVFHET